MLKKLMLKKKNVILGFVKCVGILIIKIYKKEYEKYRVIIIGVYIVVVGYFIKLSFLVE